MKRKKVIAFVVAQFVRVWVTAFASIAVYVPLSALAYAERGYKAVGGEIFPVILVAAAVWVGFDYCAQLWYRNMIGRHYDEN